jgi:hypothetical protein
METKGPGLFQLSGFTSAGKEKSLATSTLNTVGD